MHWELIYFFIFIAVIALLTTRFSDDIPAFYFNKIKYQTPATRTEYFKYDSFLSQHNPFYRKLSHDGKAMFVNRLYAFLNDKKIIGKENLEVTEEMKILVAACAIQLTFGLENFNLSLIKQIWLYPTSFYSKLLRRNITGGAYKTGFIALSWEDFIKGYQVENDKLNLGLHEMAHALKLDVLHGEEFDSKFSYYLHRWLKIGEKEFINMNKGRASFLHQYGSANEHEFFAVCVEHFFEAPQEFKEKLPDIFNHLCVLLNLNPLNDKENYALTDEYKKDENKKKNLIPLPKIIKKSYGYQKTNLIQTYIKLSFIASATIIAINFYNIIISFSELILIGGCGTLIFGIIQAPYLLKRKIIDGVDLFFYLVTAIAPSTMALFIVLNSSYTQSYQTEFFHVKQLNYTNKSLYVQIENFKYEHIDHVKEVSTLYHSGIPVYYILNTKKGLLGANQLISKGMVYQTKDGHKIYFN